MTERNRERIGAAAERARAHAPFLRTLLARRPEILAGLLTGDVAGVIAAAREPGETGAEVARALRRERQAVALAVALGDLSGALSFEEVVALLSAFADRATARALDAALRERGDAAPSGFAILALGKLGGCELNYSSDIDPILLFDPETLPRRQTEEPVEAAARVARRFVDLLQTRDGDGYVFRVDLRLRPSPEATPPALPVDAAIAYYESSALPWERAAFVRARAAAGDIALGQRFLSAVRPFVWRRGLGFGAVGEIRDISRRIRDRQTRGQAFGPGYDLKRGRGGIREVEFFTQIQQLIHGGRDPSLRARATLDALAALEGAGHVTAEEAAALTGAYRAFRTAEHRLQMIDDQQTHSLPTQAEALDNVALLDGRGSGAELIEALRPHVATVARIYDSLEPAGDTGLPRDPAALEAALSDAGFRDPAPPRARIEAWRGGTVRALRTASAQAALEAVLPPLLAGLGAAPDPAGAFARFDRMLGGLSTAIDLFRLIEARPALGALVANLLAIAPALADRLARRPALLDGLIDASAFDPPPDVATLAAEFGGGDVEEDYQGFLDRVRTRVNERRFALGAQIVAGVDPIAAAEGYARVAEAAIGTLAARTVREFEATHGRITGGELLVLGLGRLGGGALTNASDLDLVYLFTGDHLAESDGSRPLGATVYFNRLAQRVTAALSVATSAGPLYDVDTRLRPSGAQGLLAVSLDSFERYQRESAWTWEHMALTRARPVFGSEAGRAALDRILGDVLARPRDPDRVLADARTMRADVARHKPSAGTWDVKLAPGGLIDAEFTVHVLQLRCRRGLTPRLQDAVATLEAAGLLADGVADAHALLARLLVLLRLISPDSGEPPTAAQGLIARSCRAGDWAALLSARDAAYALVAAEWARVSHGL